MSTKPRGCRAPVTPEEQQRIKELFQVLGSQAKVARELNRSEYAIHCALHGRPQKKIVEPEFFDWSHYENANVIV